MDKKLQQLLKGFSELEHEEKKQKLIEMLELIKDKINMANAMSMFISRSSNVSDEFLKRNYMMIMQVAIENDEKEMNEKEKIRLDKMASIKREEQADNKDADQLLQNL